MHSSWPELSLSWRFKAGIVVFSYAAAAAAVFGGAFLIEARVAFAFSSILPQPAAVPLPSSLVERLFEFLLVVWLILGAVWYSALKRWLARRLALACRV